LNRTLSMRTESPFDHFRVGSGADERHGSKIGPLPRDKPSPHVGFRTPAKTVANDFRIWG
jgi:hypothetical protein